MAHLAEKLVALEARAAAMEKSLASSACAAPAAASAFASDEAVRSRLTQLLAVIEEDRKEAEAIRANRDELQQENEKLKEQVEKLNYRVKHLVRALESADKK